MNGTIVEEDEYRSISIREAFSNPYTMDAQRSFVSYETPGMIPRILLGLVKYSQVTGGIEVSRDDFWTFLFPSDGTWSLSIALKYCEDSFPFIRDALQRRMPCIIFNITSL